MPESKSSKRSRVAKSQISTEDFVASTIVKLLEEPTDDRRPLMRRLRNKAPVVELIRALHLARKAQTRQLICDLLGYKHAKTAVAALTDMLSDKSPKVRFAAADALAKIFMADSSQHRNGRVEAGERLYRALESESEVGLKEALIIALGALQYEPALPSLQAALDSTEEPLRKAASWALSRFTEESSAGAVGRTEESTLDGQEIGPVFHRPANFIEEAIRTLQMNPDFVTRVLRTTEDPPITFRLMQDTIKSMKATPNFYEEAIRAAQETPIFVEATIHTMEAVPNFVREAVRATQEAPSTFRIMEEMVRAINFDPAFIEEAIRVAETQPAALHSAERAIRRTVTSTDLQESIRTLAQVQDQVTHGDALTDALTQLSNSISMAGKEARGTRAREGKTQALQAVLAFLVLYLILTLAGRRWHDRLNIGVSDFEVFLATLLIWQQFRRQPANR